jgi:hypothetical protein
MNKIYHVIIAILFLYGNVKGNQNYSELVSKHLIVSEKLYKSDPQRVQDLIDCSKELDFFYETKLDDPNSVGAWFDTQARLAVYLASNMRNFKLEKEQKDKFLRTINRTIQFWKTNSEGEEKLLKLEEDAEANLEKKIRSSKMMYNYGGVNPQCVAEERAIEEIEFKKHIQKQASEAFIFWNPILDDQIKRL